MEELQKAAVAAAAEHARIAEALQEAEERLAIVDGNKMSDIDRLDILARDTEALTKELLAARLHLAGAHKDKHKARRFPPPATAEAACAAHCMSFRRAVRVNGVRAAVRAPSPLVRENEREHCSLGCLMGRCLVSGSGSFGSPRGAHLLAFGPYPGELSGAA